MERLSAAFLAVGLLWGVLGPTATSEALVVRGGTSAGLMQQPTSNYYHAVYGGWLDLGTDGGAFVGRLSYVERPQFESAGFVDQEMGMFASIGTLAAGTTDSGLWAYFGGGKMAGYLRASDDNPDDDRRRGYSIPGPTAMLEYMVSLGAFDFAAGHQTFIGYVDQTELEARVAWPYNFFHLQMGVHW